MNASVDIYRRKGLVLFDSSVLARDYEWFLVPGFEVLPADSLTEDIALGQVIERCLRHVLSLDPAVGCTAEEDREIQSAQHKAMGAKGVRDFARDNDGVNFAWNDDDGLSVTPMVADIEGGGFYAYGGGVIVGIIPPAVELGRLCREAWERGGVMQL